MPMHYSGCCLANEDDGRSDVGARQDGEPNFISGCILALGGGQRTSALTENQRVVGKLAISSPFFRWQFESTKSRSLRFSRAVCFLNSSCARRARSNSFAPS